MERGRVRRPPLRRIQP